MAGAEDSARCGDPGTAPAEDAFAGFLARTERRDHATFFHVRISTSNTQKTHETMARHVMSHTTNCRRYMINFSVALAQEKRREKHCSVRDTFYQSTFR